MATRYDILPHAQTRLLPLLAPLRDLGLVLYGGTAVALHLGHRVSIDFDFFTDRRPNRAALLATAPWLATATTIQDEPATWTVLTQGDDDEPVKISIFSGLGFGRVGTPGLSDQRDLAIASLDDLLGHKLKVLLQRVEAKDYWDIVAMLRGGQSLERGLGAACTLFDRFPVNEALKALAYFEGGDLDGVTMADREFLISQIDRVSRPTVLKILSRSLSTCP